MPKSSTPGITTAAAAAVEVAQRDVVHAAREARSSGRPARAAARASGPLADDLSGRGRSR